MKRPLAVVGALLLGLALALVAYFNYDLRYAIARVQGDTPEGPVEMYLEAVSRGNEGEAVAAWHVEGYKRAELEARRSAVTRAFVAQASRAYRIESAEWWSHCCEPHIVDSRRFANGARLTVDVGGERFIFDVLARARESIWDGLPARGWVLMDVYPVGQPAIWNTWPGRD